MAELEDLLRRTPQGNTVLFVDDEPNILAGLRRSLHRQHFHLLTATSGEAALDILGDQTVQLVVSDQDMPGMTGIALLREIRRRYPQVLCYMLTGKASLELAVAAINQGDIHRFFTKPCCIDELVCGLQQGLEHQHLLAVARTLLARFQSQQQAIEHAEQQFPGISRILRDEDGAIVLDL